MTSETFRELIREELAPVTRRLDRIEGRLKGVEGVIVHLAQCFPGSMPGHDSHVVTAVREKLG